MSHASEKRQSVATGDCRDFGYVADDHWAKLPPNWIWEEVAAVAVNRDDRVFVFGRGEHPLALFAPDGTFLGFWHENPFTRQHGISICPDSATPTEVVFCTDDLGHAVRKFTLEGTLLLTLGEPGQPSETGATSLDFRSIRQASGPFHYPTNVALSPEHEIYVSDGYGNARVHKFAPDGRLLFSWGEPGDGPGEFGIPHGIAVDRRGTVYVADRENSRLQLFTPQGEFLDQWTDVVRPCQVFIDRTDTVYVAELGYRAGMWPGISSPSPDAPGGRVSIFNLDGELLARWGGGRNPCAPGDFFAPHDICVDSRGDIYVAEVVMSAGGRRGLVPPDCHSLQKFIRQ